jgi:hypothetical protein
LVVALGLQSTEKKAVKTKIFWCPEEDTAAVISTTATYARFTRITGEA